MYSIWRHSFSSLGVITVRLGMQRRYDRSKRAVMRRAICAHQAAAIDGEHHRQVLDRDVMDQLVVRALQEGRVDRHHRLHAFAGQAGGERHGVLLGDADVEVALREMLREAHQAGAFAHRRRDPDQALVQRRPCRTANRRRSACRSAWPAGLLCNAGARSNLLTPWYRIGIVLGQRVALALCGDDVQELRPVELLHVAQRGTSTSRSWPSIGPM